MSHECKHGSCGSGSHHSHSTCSCCGCKSSECGNGCGCSCHHHHHHHDCHKYSDELLCLADQAWMELVKEKIKEEIQKNSGEHINQLASLVAKANHARWTYKMDEKKNEQTYEDELRNLLLRKK